MLKSFLFVAAPVFLAAFLLASCSGSSDRGSYADAGDQNKATASASEPGDNGVTKSQFEAAGLQWPLTVDSGSIGCDGMAYWFQTTDGTKYGLNGFASKRAGYVSIEPIWAVDEKTRAELPFPDAAPIVRVNIGDMINQASKVCGR